jgi:hypothetical protein
MIEDIEIVDMGVSPTKRDQEGFVEFGERCNGRARQGPSNARVGNESRKQINSEYIVLTLALSFVGWPILFLALPAYVKRFSREPCNRSRFLSSWNKLTTVGAGGTASTFQELGLCFATKGTLGTHDGFACLMFVG